MSEKKQATLKGIDLLLRKRKKRQIDSMDIRLVIVITEVPSLE